MSQEICSVSVGTFAVASVESESDYTALWRIHRFPPAVGTACTSAQTATVCNSEEMIGKTLFLDYTGAAFSFPWVGRQTPPRKHACMCRVAFDDGAFRGNRFFSFKLDRFSTSTRGKVDSIFQHHTPGRKLPHPHQGKGKGERAKRFIMTREDEGNEHAFHQKPNERLTSFQSFRFLALHKNVR